MKKFRIYGLGMPIEIEAYSSEHAELLAFHGYPFLAEVDITKIWTRPVDA